MLSGAEAEGAGGSKAEASCPKTLVPDIQEPRYSWPRSAVIRIGRVSCHQGKSTAVAGDPLPRYLVGRQYWRLVSYIQGLWPSLAGLPRIPHLAVIGISGCGKSWTFAAAVSFLRQSRLQAQYRVVCVSDCSLWMDSAEPLPFFCMEVLLALRADEDAELKLVKSRLVGQPEEICPWLAVIDQWLARSDLHLVVFVDQVEALLGKPDSVQNAVIQALIDMKRAIVVMALTVDGPSERSAIANWGFSRLGFHQMRFPYYLPSTEYAFLADLFIDPPLSLHEGALMREVRLYTGGVMRELVACLTRCCKPDGHRSEVSPEQCWLPVTLTGVELTTRIDSYRRAVMDRVVHRIEGVLEGLDRVQRVAFLLVIFRMILRLPADAATSSVSLPSELRSLFLPGAVQKFYHSRDSIAVILHIPTAVSHSVHLALSSSKVLHILADRPLQVIHRLIASIMDSKSVCSESKRRLVRFYVIHRLSCYQQVTISGLSDFDRTVEVDTGAAFVMHHFAGLTPAKDILAWLLAQAIVAGEQTAEEKQRASISEVSRAVPMVLIPGRTDYCFFDYFVFNPGLRKLFAVSSAASPSDWQRGPAKGGLGAAKENVITPSSLVETWTRVFRDVLPIKFSVHCVSIRPNDLLAATDCPWRPSEAL